MKYKRMGRTGLRVSEICMGTMTFGGATDEIGFVGSGKNVQLPVMGVFEIRDGKIAAWRDYFDLAAWTKENA